MSDSLKKIHYLFHISSTYCRNSVLQCIALDEEVFHDFLSTPCICRLQQIYDLQHIIIALLSAQQSYDLSAAPTCWLESYHVFVTQQIEPGPIFSSVFICLSINVCVCVSVCPCVCFTQRDVQSLPPT